MVQLPVVYGKWVMKDLCWNFEVDNCKGGRMLFIEDGCAFGELHGMVQDDYDLDAETIELTYSLPAVMLQELPPNTPPMHVTNDRQVRSLVELCKMHVVRLCVSCATQVSENEADRCASDDDEDYSEYGKVKEEDEDVDHFVKFNHVEEDAQAAYMDGGDYSEYGKVKDEDEDIDQIVKFNHVEEDAQANGIYVGRSFASKVELISTLRRMSILLKFTFHAAKSSKDLFVAECCVPACRWKVRAITRQAMDTFWVTKYENVHTCSVGERYAYFRVPSPKHIGKLFIDSFGVIDGITPRHITDSMKHMYGLRLGYTTAYRSLLYAQQMVRGSVEDGYGSLPSYLHLIQEANPGTVTGLELDDENRFKYLFISFGASIAGFNFLRRVIVVDGCHLTGKYGGVMLVATAQDGNFQIFPLAFGIVDTENDASWEWFLTKLGSCFSHQLPLVLVSDRHSSIKNACDRVLPWVTRGICYYHLQCNIVTKFRGKQLLYLVKGAAYAYTLADFDRHMDELMNINPTLAKYLVDADPKLWSRANFPGDRYNIQTSNIAESLNAAFKLAREFPITFLLDYIREKLGKWFYKRREDACRLQTCHTRGVENLLAIRGDYATKMDVERIDSWRFYAKVGVRNFLVDLEHGTCACGVYQIEKIPCSHVIAAALHAGIHVNTLVCPIYRKEYLTAAYGQNIYPKSDNGVHKQDGCHPPEVKILPGRKKKSRWQTWLEMSKMRVNKRMLTTKQYNCSKCNQPGHTRINCVSSIIGINSR